MTRRPWTPAEVDILRHRYPDTPTAQLAESMGRTDRQLYNKALALGLKKSAAYLASPEAFHLRREQSPGAIARRFQPGHSTWNKGLKGLDMGGKATRFQPGQRSGIAAEQWKPLGSERTCKDGYLQIKITDDPAVPAHRRWAMAHNLIWQSVHGRPVPPGHRVCYLNGDKTDLGPENLGLTTAAEMMRRNTIHNLPAPIKSAYQLLGAIDRQLRKREGKSA